MTICGKSLTRISFEYRLLAVLCVFLASGTPMSRAQAVPQPDQPKPAISQSDLARLRPAVLPDLKKAVALLNNDTVTRADLFREFKNCKLTPLNLRSLGAAVLVEWNPLKAPNASMLNVYALQRNAYRHVIEEMGWGPVTLPEPRPVPDLVFGWSEGVCHATYSRYRFLDGSYKADACNQETEGKDGDCAIVPCKNKLPIFANPFPNS